MKGSREDQARRPRRTANGGEWRRTFNMMRMAAIDPHSRPEDLTPEGRLRRDNRAWYRLNVVDSQGTQVLVIEVYEQRRRADGSWGRIASYPLGFSHFSRWVRAADREIVALLEATAPQMREHRRRYVTLAPCNYRSFVPAMLHASVLPRLCATGRFFRSARRPSQGGLKTILKWQDGPPWTFVVAVERLPAGDDPEDRDDRVRLTGRLRRGEHSRAVTAPEMLIDGCMLDGDVIAAFGAGVTPEAGERSVPPEADRLNIFPWIWQLREDGDILVSTAQLDEMLDELWNLPFRPPVEMPAEWPLDEVRLAPRPRLVVRSPRRRVAPEARRETRDAPEARMETRDATEARMEIRDAPAKVPADGLSAEVRFDYDGLVVAAHDARDYLVDRPGRRVARRDHEAEEATIGRLLELGAEEAADGRFEIDPGDFPDLVWGLLEAGWIVEAEGRKVRSPGAVRLRVSSGIDWLELRGDVRFEGGGEDAGGGDLLMPLPELLLAVRRRERLIRLDDGSHGILPQEWLERYGPLARLGDPQGEAWRFLPAHAILIDALLEGEEEAEVDGTFERLRERLHALDELEPHPEPRTFTGELRPYQRHGLAWLHALRFLGLGGCLADDMGLGKTVQVLALLASRPIDDGPSLVVVPRSLISNWLEEAARFAPNLRVTSYHGQSRDSSQITEHDVVVTTYGTVRRDVDELAQVAFDLVVLDEAQAIKNVFSQTAKACRRLDAGQRLALTGTPVENHLGELGSIFGFLNPGMLGRVPGFEELLGQSQPEPESLALLGRVMRPFILRRTKEAVLPELPERTEQILYCDLRERQKRLYDELRDHYRAAVGRQIDEVGLNRSKIQVIEALLRLRQAACHPGLVDPTRGHQRSTKLDVLLRHLREVLDEGHKALVFSQFTRFLGLLRQRLDRLGTRYQYLDGRTRDRRTPVERFQNDPDCPLFLISLKAGGFGLNLTAADYVFLLDPWWNPAVEAQAIDRTHRIGQQRPVFAYRLVARGTIEEKILELQAKKRRLADAILSPGEGMMRTLSEEDLRWLLCE